MPDRPDKQSRKDKLHALRSQQRAPARAALPMDDAKMKAMFDMLDAALTQRGCDHTLQLVQEWAMQQGVDFAAPSAWCRANGGHCDCEVLANCEERWQDATHDVP